MLARKNCINTIFVLVQFVTTKNSKQDTAANTDLKVISNRPP